MIPLHYTHNRRFDRSQLVELYHQTEWGKKYSLKKVRKLVRYSDVILSGWNKEKDELVVFARVLTDYVQFAVIVDVLIKDGYHTPEMEKELFSRLMKAKRLDMAHKYYLAKKNRIQNAETLGFKNSDADFWIKLK